MLQRVIVCSFFYVFEIKENLRKITGGWEKGRQELDYMIMCFLKGGYNFQGYNFWHFKYVLT